MLAFIDLSPKSAFVAWSFILAWSGVVSRLVREPAIPTTHVKDEASGFFKQGQEEQRLMLLNARSNPIQEQTDPLHIQAFGHQLRMKLGCHDSSLINRKKGHCSGCGFITPLLPFTVVGSIGVKHLKINRKRNFALL